MSDILLISTENINIVLKAFFNFYPVIHNNQLEQILGTLKRGISAENSISKTVPKRGMNKKIDSNKTFVKRKLLAHFFKSIDRWRLSKNKKISLSLNPLYFFSHQNKLSIS